MVDTCHTCNANLNTTMQLFYKGKVVKDIWKLLLIWLQNTEYKLIPL